MSINGYIAWKLKDSGDKEEDTLEENIVTATDEVAEEDNTVDATLEQLATEFAETQDKTS